MSEAPDSTTDIGAGDTDALPEMGSALEAFCGCANPLDEILMMTTGIVVAYVGSTRHLPDGGVPALIAQTYAALAYLNGSASPVETQDEPAINPEIKSEAEFAESITPDHLISFVDGASYKTLRRHLRLHGYTPESYRKTFGLPADYPMTSANYSAVRSEMAKSMGLGSHRARAAETRAAV